MMNFSRTILISLAVLVVAGCASSREPAPVEDLGGAADSPTAGQAQTVPSPLEVPSTGEAVTIPLGYSATPRVDSAALPPPPDGEAAANPAVVALLNDANLAMQNGRDDRAAASLERALSIEPRNAWLWHRLASTRLKQGELDQAAALAARSNSYAAPDRQLQAANWRIIAEVHRRLGEFDAAKSAEQQATRLQSP